MDIQEIIVSLIVLLCLVGLGYRILHYINRIRKHQSPCEGCHGRCECGCGEKKG